MNPALTDTRRGPGTRGRRTKGRHEGHGDVPVALRAITFDVYSALYDTVSGLQQALGALMQTRGTGGGPAALARAWPQRRVGTRPTAQSPGRDPARHRPPLAPSAPPV